LEKKPRVPIYKTGDLVQFEYDGDFRKKVKRVVCVESLHYENESKDPDRWEGWYVCHLMFDEQGKMDDPHYYKLQAFPESNISKRILIARIGE